MSSENNKKRFTNPLNITWQLKLNQIELEEKVHAIIETIKTVHNKDYQESLDKNLRGANKKIEERKNKLSKKKESGSRQPAKPAEKAEKPKAGNFQY
jgi:hypothetical protein